MLEETQNRSLLASTSSEFDDIVVNKKTENESKIKVEDSVGKFRKSNKNHFVTLFQLFTFTILLYCCYSTFLPIFCLLFHISTTKDYPLVFNLFNCQKYSWAKQNSCQIFTYLSTMTIFAPWVMLKIVRTSKMCVDFTVSFTVIHTVICCISSTSFGNLSFWITHIIAAIFCSIFSEILCRIQENKSINLSMYR
ncbi:hypothetical protein A3Q56_06106 [Intoshia linei]|uniref:Protein SYS1 n=1 Tax=Intoshia linei TaxID=1819745 RepID=A0A177AXP1_9BILA|nr:hypothetical protein A3Q56_06106 [Intoshia linei]